MNVTFSFDNHDFLQSGLSVSGEWKAPFLPRVGDKIHASLMKEMLSPKELYDALNTEEKEMWDRWVKEDLDVEMTEEEALEENYGIWLWHVGSVISEIIWGKNENGYHALITLKGAGA